MSPTITPECTLLSLMSLFAALLHLLHSKEIPAQRGCEREQGTVAKDTKDQAGISCGGDSEEDKQQQQHQ